MIVPYTKLNPIPVLYRYPSSSQIKSTPNSQFPVKKRVGGPPSDSCDTHPPVKTAAAHLLLPCMPAIVRHVHFTHQSKATLSPKNPHHHHHHHHHHYHPRHHHPSPEDLPSRKKMKRKKPEPQPGSLPPPAPKNLTNKSNKLNYADVHTSIPDQKKTS